MHYYDNLGEFIFYTHCPIDDPLFFCMWKYWIQVLILSLEFLFGVAMVAVGDGTRGGCQPVGCAGDPPPCYPGTKCADSADGPHCGPCPPGLTGMDHWHT